MPIACCFLGVVQSFTEKMAPLLNLFGLFNVLVFLSSYWPFVESLENSWF